MLARDCPSPLLRFLGGAVRSGSYFATFTLLLVSVSEVNPDLLPVTVTVSFAPRSAETTTWPGAVAPEIFLPLRYHWIARVTGAGDQVPVTAVSVLPTCGIPLIVGRTPVSFPPVTRTVGALVAVADEYPALDPVTDTVSVLPASAWASL